MARRKYKLSKEDQERFNRIINSQYAEDNNLYKVADIEGEDSLCSQIHDLEREIDYLMTTDVIDNKTIKIKSEELERLKENRRKITREKLDSYNNEMKNFKEEERRNEDTMDLKSTRKNLRQSYKTLVDSYREKIKEAEEISKKKKDFREVMKLVDSASKKDDENTWTTEEREAVEKARNLHVEEKELESNNENDEE